MIEYRKSKELIEILLNSDIRDEKRQKALQELCNIVLSGKLFESSGNQQLTNVIASLENGLESKSNLVSCDCAYLLGCIYAGKKDINSIEVYPLELQQGPRVALAKQYFTHGMQKGDERCADELFLALLHGKGGFMRNYDALKHFCEEAVDNNNYPASVRARIAVLYGVSLCGFDPITQKPFEWNAAFPVDNKKATDYLKLAEKMRSPSFSVVGNPASKWSSSQRLQSKAPSLVPGHQQPEGGCQQIAVR